MGLGKDWSGRETDAGACGLVVRSVRSFSSGEERRRRRFGVEVDGPGGGWIFFSGCQEVSRRDRLCERRGCRLEGPILTEENANLVTERIQPSADDALLYDTL